MDYLDEDAELQRELENLAVSQPSGRHSGGLGLGASMVEEPTTVMDEEELQAAFGVGYKKLGVESGQNVGSTEFEVALTSDHGQDQGDDIA